MSRNSRFACGFAGFLVLAAHLFAMPVSGQTQWRPVESFYGAMVTAVAIDSAGRYWAATDTLLYASDDQGRTWRVEYLPPPAGSASEPISSITISPTGAMVVTTSLLAFRRGLGDSSWTSRTVLGPIRRMKVGAGGRFLGGGNYGALLWSDDDGMTWSWQQFGFDVRDVLLVPGTGTLVATEEGIRLRPVDSCCWETRSPVNSYSFAVTPSGAILAGGAELQRSTDNGRTWTLVSGADSLPMHLSTNPDGHVLATSRGRVCRSTDDGETWTRLITSSSDLYPSPRSIGAIATTRSGEILTGLNPSLAVSTDGGSTWRKSGQGIYELRAVDISVGEQGQVAIVDAETKLYLASDLADTFSVLNPFWFHRAIAQVLYARDGSLLGGRRISMFAVERSTDNGATWSRVFETETSGGPMSFRTDYRGRVYMLWGKGLARSTDNGATWARIVAADFGTLYDIAVGRDGSIVAAGAYEMWRSGDDGVTWAQVMKREGWPRTLIVLRCLAIGVDGIFYGGNIDGVYRSTDHGVTWTMTNLDGLWSRGTNALIVGRDGSLYSGSAESGVFRYAGEERGWRLMNDGIENVPVVFLRELPDGRLLVAARRGLYIATPGPSALPLELHTRTRPGGELEVVDVRGELRLRLAGWSVPEPAVTIVDILGRTVAKCRAVAPEISLGDLPPGVYTAVVTDGITAASRTFPVRR